MVGEYPGRSASSKMSPLLPHLISPDVLIYLVLVDKLVIEGSRVGVVVSDGSLLCVLMVMAGFDKVFVNYYLRQEVICIILVCMCVCVCYVGLVIVRLVIPLPVLCA